VTGPDENFKMLTYILHVIISASRQYVAIGRVSALKRIVINYKHIDTVH